MVRKARQHSTYMQTVFAYMFIVTTVEFATSFISYLTFKFPKRNHEFIASHRENMSDLNNLRHVDDDGRTLICKLHI